MPRSDFNGDGRDDIFWRHESGLVTNWLGTADASFVNNHANSARLVPADWQILGVGDFNGDGMSDVLWRHVGGMVTNWLGTANGSFVNNHANSATLVPTDWQIEGVGDFNGDGMSDVLWRHDRGLVTNWLGTANGSFVNNHANSAALVPVEWRITGVGDFNGDGNSDILWQNDTELLTNWLGTDSGGFARNDAVALARLRFDVEETGDFNGDGRDDILVGDDWGFISAYLARPDGSFNLDDYNPFADATDKLLASSATSTGTASTKSCGAPVRGSKPSSPRFRISPRACRLRGKSNQSCPALGCGIIEQGRMNSAACLRSGSMAPNRCYRPRFVPEPRGVGNFG